MVKEGPSARRELDKSAQRASDRSFVERIDPTFRELSPERGELDENAAAAALRDDLDAGLARLATAANTSDEVLRRLAKRLAGRVIVHLGQGGGQRRRGVGHLAPGRLSPGDDLDVDASIGEIAEARAVGRAVDGDLLVGRHWVREEHALTLLVDRSGSMGGERLVTAALAAAVVACRAPDDYSVIAFAGDAVVIKSQDVARPTDSVLDDLLSLHGYGTTDLARALRAGSAQLARSRARRKVGILLSDGAATAGADPLRFARDFEILHVIAPPGDAVQAAALARAGGGRFAQVVRPSELPEVLLRVLG
jgi:hypothetical protein